jgi:tripartite motif-containing protein 9/67
VVAQCDSLIRFIEEKKIELLQVVTTEINKKIKNLNNQIKDCEGKAYEAKGLIEYTMEVLREVDPSSFLLVRLRRTNKIWGYL